MSSPESAEPPLEPGHNPFPIVGVGASAGGLEAFTELLENLPPSPGMALLFVLHLERHHKSHVPEILSKVTAIPIQEATEGMAVEADHIYVIPPNMNIALNDGALTLTPRSPGYVQNMPIDYLFRSLAQIQKNRAIGVILSGGGSDGTLGFQSIKAEGGITLAQSEKSARQDSMPRNAIADGHVDYVLAPREIAHKLIQLARHSYTQETSLVAEPPAAAADTVAQIVALLRSSLHVDFTHYKRSTIQRRIQRRMALVGLEDRKAYLHLLRQDAAEVRNLFQDFLIRVTQFFRDPEAFEALKENVLPALVKDRRPTDPIRVWVAGCSTGEEVYSMAIALLEYLGNRADNVPIKILATDLNEAALDKARAGVYIDNIEIDVTPERLRRFFLRSDGHYQISKTVRDLCVFSRHNMAADPPFSRLDLISCRNVLIYMDTALQRRVLPILHYSLNPNGYLLLGGSENIGSSSDLFEVVDSKARIFVKKVGPAGAPLDFGASVTPEGSGYRLRPEGVGPHWSALDVQREADRILLARYAPVGVVVDETMTVLQFRGRTAAFLEPAPGLASLDLLRMLREGLLAEVRAALNEAKTENAPVVRRGVPLLDRNQQRVIQVEAIPFKVPSSGARFFLVLFQDRSSADEGPAPAAPAQEGRAPSADHRVAQLQQELQALREYLQSVIEEQESTNEELTSANEEILSSNEELQSTNEELQTAKEEAQSANEELITVNEELHHRNAELAVVNNDLVNFLSGVSIPIVMVSRDLRIRRYTPLAEKLFNLIPTDVGRPISDIKPNLRNGDLAQMIATTIDTLVPQENVIQDREGRWYWLRIKPYITLDNKIDGASIVLLDIDAIKKNLETMKAGENEGERGASSP